MNQDFYMLFKDAKERHVESYNNFDAKLQKCINCILEMIDNKIGNAIKSNDTFIELMTQCTNDDSFFNIYEKYKIPRKKYDSLDDFILNTLHIKGYCIKPTISHVYRVSW